MAIHRALSGIILITAFGVTPAFAADCLQRLDELRQRQTEMPLLDAQRPDLVTMRKVARDLAQRGKTGLCNELADELSALLDSHRSHVAKVKQLSTYALATPISQIDGELDSGQLVGMTVRDRVGDELGEVHGLDIDASSGLVKALIVSRGGFLGINETRVPIPWRSVLMATDGSAVVLDMTEDELQAVSSD